LRAAHFADIADILTATPTDFLPAFSFPLSSRIKPVAPASDLKLTVVFRAASRITGSALDSESEIK
jgi:hypothetical protein